MGTLGSCSIRNNEKLTENMESIISTLRKQDANILDSKLSDGAKKLREMLNFKVGDTVAQEVLEQSIRRAISVADIQWRQSQTKKNGAIVLQNMHQVRQQMISQLELADKLKETLGELSLANEVIESLKNEAIDINNKDNLLSPYATNVFRTRINLGSETNPNFLFESDIEFTSLQQALYVAERQWLLSKGILTQEEFDDYYNKYVKRKGKLHDSVFNDIKLTDKEVSLEWQGYTDENGVKHKGVKERILEVLINDLYSKNEAANKALKETLLSPFSFTTDKNAALMLYKYMDKYRRKAFYEGTQYGVHRDTGTRENANKQSALESLEAKRPEDIFTPEQLQMTERLNALNAAFPDLSEQKAYVDFTIDMFGKTLEFLVDSQVKILQNKLAKDPNDAIARKYLADITGKDEIQNRYRFLERNSNDPKFAQNLYKAIRTNIRFMTGIKAEDNQLLLDYLIHKENKNEDGIQKTYEAFSKKYKIPRSSFEYLMNLFFADTIEQGKQEYPRDQKKRKNFYQTRIEQMKGGGNVAMENSQLARMIKNDKVFYALLDKARFPIMVEHGLLLNVTENSIGSMRENTEDTMENQENSEREAYMIKYQTVDPQATLSKRMKNILANQYNATYKMGNNGKMYIKYVFDELGFKTKMSPASAYARIQAEFEGLKGPKAFDKKADEMLKKFAWFKPLYEKIHSQSSLFDKDFRNEFFRTFASKSFYNFTYIDNQGNMVQLNRDFKAAELMAMMSKSYNIGMPLNNLSIYTTTGKANQTAIAQLLQGWGKNATILNAVNPINAMVSDINLTEGISVSQAKTNLIARTNVINKAIANYNKLRTSKKYNLETMLQAIGIDTQGLDIEAVMPEINFEEVLQELYEHDEEGNIQYDTVTTKVSEIDEKTKRREYKEKTIKIPRLKGQEFNWANVIDKNDDSAFEAFQFAQDKFNDFARMIRESAPSIDKLSGIYDKIRQILRAFSENPRSDLFQTNKSFYLSLLNAMPLNLEAFESDEFRFAGDQRFSYVATSYLKDIEIAIRDGAKTDEESQNEFKEYMHEKYGKYDWFSVQDKELSDVGLMQQSWLPLFNDMFEMEDGKFTDRALAIRRRFAVLNVLGIGGQEKNLNDPAKVTNRDTKALRRFTLMQFFNVVASKVGNQYIQFANYRGPLFSDSGNNVMFTMPKYATQQAIKGIARIIEQEYTRIKESQVSKRVRDIDGYGKASVTFTMFPQLNHKIELTIPKFDENTGEIEVNANGEEVFEKKTFSVIEELDNINRNDNLTDHQKSKARQILLSYVAEEVVNRESAIILEELGEDKSELSRFVQFVKKAREKQEKYTEQGVLNEESQEEESEEESNEEAEENENTGLMSKAEYEAYVRKRLDLKEEDEIDADALEELENNEIAQLQEMVYEFTANDILAQTQITQLLVGDPAIYGTNFRNLIKRIKEMNTAGERIWSLDDNGKEKIQKAIYFEDMFTMSTTFRENARLFAKDLATNKDGVVDPNDQALYLGALSKYMDINSTDGQSLRNLDSVKWIYEAMGGKWNSNMEAALQRIKDGKATIEDFKTFVEPMKPFVKTFEDVVADQPKGGSKTLKIGVQYKNSEYALSLISTLMTARVHQNNIRLQALMEVMNNKENPIDVMHFHSAIKTGAFDLIDVNFDHKKLRDTIDAAFTDGRYNEKTGNLTLNIKLENGRIVPVELKGIKRSDNDTDLFGAYRKAVAKLQSENTHAEINGLQANENYLSNEEIEDLYNKFEFDSKEAIVEYINSVLEQNGKTDAEGVLRKYIHETPYSDYRIMQPSSDHLMDTDALIGTQLINVLPADLVESTTVQLYQSEDIKGQDINKLYQMVLAEMDLAMYKEIQRTFGSIENLQQMLYNKMRKNSQYGPELYKSLEIVERDGVKQFRDPLNSPLIANKVQPLLFGVFKDLVQRKRIKGGNVVLVSDYGLRDDLKIEYLRDSNNDIIGVKYMEAYISAPSENFIKDFTTYDENTKSYHIDLEKMKQSMTEEEIDDVLTMIGYRVPTENKFSIAQIKIKGFLPANMGTAIILPSDIVEMSGTDFDELSTSK